MLCINNYTFEFIRACRANVDKQMKAYQATIAPLEAESRGEFEDLFLRNMVVVLDAQFTHRSRTLERNEGNAMNEVRILAYSIVNSSSLLTLPYKNTVYGAIKSIAGIGLGAPIHLTVDSFEKLAASYFANIEATFGA